MLMRPEAAFPYVFAAEGAQHPQKKSPRSTTLVAAPPATKIRIGRGHRHRYGRCRRAILLCSDETLQRFASLDLKSRIDARKRV